MSFPIQDGTAPHQQAHDVSLVQVWALRHEVQADVNFGASLRDSRSLGGAIEEGRAAPVEFWKVVCWLSAGMQTGLW